MANWERSQRGGITRRRFMRDAGLATVAAAEIAASPAVAASRRRKAGRPTVAVFGGGIAGLTAAHELAERGFRVTVYERRAWGGKARSTEVPDSAKGGRGPLPGEHSERAFFGFEYNLPDTLRRIPASSNARGALDNLVQAPQLSLAREGRRDLVLPFGRLDPRPYTPAQVADLLVGLLAQTNLPPEAVAYFAQRLVVFFSSCDQRKTGQWEHTTWTDFTASERFSEDYRRILVRSIPEVVQASKAERTSAVFPAQVFEWLIYSLLGRTSDAPTISVLNAPTNQAWIDPWLSVLRRLGVRLHNRRELTRWHVRDSRIAGARVRSSHGVATVRADWYVCALPVERARRLWSRTIRASDPHLARMHNLDTAWMNGIKFFLREQTPIVNGHIFYADSAWRVASISQAQFWPVDFANTYGDGTVRDCISALAANWTVPGPLTGKPANDCTPDEVAREIWDQIKRSINDTGPAILSDDLLVCWDIDPGMIRRADRLISDDPLVLPTVGQGPDRPEVETAIPNLLLAGDYLKSPWHVANMETANFNGRRAANAVLDRAGSREALADTIEPYRPPEWEPLKEIDAQRYANGQPNLFDANMTLDQLNTLLAQTEKLVGIQLP